MQTQLKNSDDFGINTKARFSAIASELAHKIDEPSLNRAYVQWSRNCDICEDSARRYLSMQLPNSTDVILSSVEMKVQNACKWLKSQSLPYRETISGVAVSHETYDRLRSFMQASQPLRPIFDKFCDKQGIANTHSAYHHFCRCCGKTIIKIHFHPVYTGYKEFWMRPLEELDALLEKWAEMCTTPENNGTSTLDITRNPTAVVPETVRGLKSVNNLVKSICTIPTRFQTEVNRTVHDKLQGSALIIEPQSGRMDQYYSPENEDQVTGEIRKVVSSLQIRPLSDLKAITGLPLAKLKKHAVDGYIDVRQLGSQFFISETEVKRIQALSDQFVSLDMVVNTELSNIIDSSFNLAWRRDREALINHIKDNELFDSFCVYDPTMPLNGGCTGFFVNAKKARTLGSKLQVWLRGYKKTNEAKLDVLLEEMGLRFPRTHKSLQSFINREYERPNALIHKSFASYIEMVDMLLSCMTRELDELDPEDFKDELIAPNQYNSITSCNLLADFLVSSRYTTRRYGFSLTGFHPNKDSYAIRDFAVIVANCCNKEIWEENNLVQKAIENKTYASMWLYVTLHVYSAWRNSDYIRLHEPKLQYTPEETLEKIRIGTYTKADAELVAERFLVELQLRGLKPNKTEEYRNIPNLYFCCPQSCKESFGIILSIVAAHHQLSGDSSNFVRSDFSQGNYRRFFGEAFSQACGNRAFSGRRANKALMQAVETQAREGEQWNSYIAYTLASTLRSHKGGYRTLAETTDIYLRDCNFSGITPEDAVYQMFERGICSWVVDELLERCYAEEYKSLPTRLKTEAITSLGLTPYNISGLLDAVHTAQDNAIAVIEECVSAGGDVKLAIRRILSGQARTPLGDSDCLLRAMGLKVACPQSNCTNCRYEIRTIATLARYWSEYCRLLTIVDGMSDFEIRRNRALANKMKPTLVEIITHYCNDSLGIDELNIRKDILGGMFREIQVIYRSRGFLCDGGSDEH